MFDGRGCLFVGKEANLEGYQAVGLVLVHEIRFAKSATDRYPTLQLLHELPLQGFGKGFPVLYLAPGELPLSGRTRSVKAFPEENLAAPEADAGNGNAQRFQLS